MSDESDRIEYALAKQVTDMARGFAIETNYGMIEISSAQAEPIIKAVREALQKELAEMLQA